MRRALQRASRAAQSPAAAAAARLLDQATAASEEDRNHGIRIITQRKIQQQTNQTEGGESHSHRGGRHIVVGGRDGVLGARARHGSRRSGAPPLHPPLHVRRAAAGS